MRNVLHDLRPTKGNTTSATKDLAELLTKEVFVGDKNEELKEDLDWRINNQFGDDLDFWSLAKADFPYELSEKITSPNDGPLRAESAGEGPLDGSVLEKKVPQFQGAHLVLAPFRIFHRADGKSDNDPSLQQY